MLVLSLVLMLQASTTTCTTNSGITTCNSRDMGVQTTPPIDYSQKPARREFEPMQITGGGRPARASKIRRKVGKLVAEGKCEEARTAALQEGEFALAGLARSSCPSK